MRDCAARAKPMTATATRMVKAIWHAYFVRTGNQLPGRARQAFAFWTWFVVTCQALLNGAQAAHHHMQAKSASLCHMTQYCCVHPAFYSMAVPYKGP